jgi:collagenase-like PrtC family protease
MKFSIGYQLPSDFESIYETVKEFREHIAEVYYAEPHAPSGRAPLGLEEGLPAEKAWDIMKEELSEVAKMGIERIFLLNGACYGKRAISCDFAKDVCGTLERLLNAGLVSAITTTSPFIARVVKAAFPNLPIRASVNMRIGMIQGMEYLSELFDGYYLQREYNRNLNHIKQVKSWCDKNGKTLHLLVNSGCLAYCSAQTYHDNLVAHEAEVRHQKNIPLPYPSMCWEYLLNALHWPVLLQSSWIRPEDLYHYRPWFSIAKLATRMHHRLRTVVQAYVQGSFNGNLLELLEPGFGPILKNHVIGNKLFPNDWFEQTASCNRQCHTCGYCRNVLKQVLC